MRKDIDHLPQVQQAELERATRILLEEFSVATLRATHPWKRNGKVHKIVLFGSYARGDWVDAPRNGYQSDYDLLVIVSHAALTDIADYWYVAEDRMLRDLATSRQVNIIVHTLEEVNRGLTRGEYFRVDIVRDGIALYEGPGAELTSPQPLTAADAYEMASGYFRKRMGKVDSGLKIASYALAENENNDAAFLLHQTAERAYICFLLVRTLYRTPLAQSQVPALPRRRQGAGVDRMLATRHQTRAPPLRACQARLCRGAVLRQLPN